MSRRTENGQNDTGPGPLTPWTVRPALVAALLLSAILAARLVNLRADPPHGFSAFESDFMDEGLYAHSARNKVLFGQWVIDEFNPLLVTPTVTLSHYVFFSLFGVGYASARLTSVLASLVLAGALFLLVRRRHGSLWACVSLVLLGCNFYFTVFSRQALLEIPVAAFATLALLFLDLGRRRPLGYALSGACIVLALLTKYLHSYLAVAMLSGVALVPLIEKRGRRLRPPLLFLCGAAVPLALTAALLLVPFWEDYLAYNRNYGAKRLPAGWDTFVENVGGEPFWSYFRWRAPLVVALLPLWLLCAADDLKRRGRVDPTEIVALLSIAGGVAFFALLDYRPERYYAPLFPAMVLLAVGGLARIWGDPPRPAWISVAGWSAFLLATARSVQPPPLKALAFLGGVLALAGPFLPALARRPGLARGAALGVMLAALAAKEGGEYARWAVDPRYTLYDASRHLGTLIRREGAYIVGKGFSLPLCLENRHHPVLVAEMWNRDALVRYRHAYLLEDRGKRQAHFQRFPGVAKKARWLQDYDVMGKELDLFALPPARKRRAAGRGAAGGNRYDRPEEGWRAQSR